jgi:hypothetical protein
MERNNIMDQYLGPHISDYSDYGLRVSDTAWQVCTNGMEEPTATIFRAPTYQTIQHHITVFSDAI